MGSVIAIAVLLTLISLELVFQYVVLKASLPIFEGKPPFGTEHHPRDPSAEAIEIPAGSGLVLRGSLFRTLKGEPRGLILFCHELDSDRWSALSYCEGLLAAGFHVLAFDFRNHGESDAQSGYEPTCWLSSYEVEDVAAAVDYIAGRPELSALPLGVFGISRGGGAALMAAAASPAVRCVCTDGAYSLNEMLYHFTRRWGTLYVPGWLMRLEPRWHMLTAFWVIRVVSQIRRGCRYASIERALDQLRNKPVLMFSGDRDTYVSPRITRALCSRSGQGDASVWIVPGAKHNMARQAATDEYDRRLIEFFSLLDESISENRAVADEVAPVNGQSYGVRHARPSEMTAG